MIEYYVGYACKARDMVSWFHKCSIYYMHILSQLYDVLRFGSTVVINVLITISSSSSVMSNLRAACGPVKGFGRPSLGICCSASILHTDNQSLF